MNNRTLSFFEDEEKLMIGVNKEFWWRRTLILHCILFSIPYSLNLFSNYYKYCIIVDMDLGRNFVWTYSLIFCSRLRLHILKIYMIICWTTIKIILKKNQWQNINIYRLATIPNNEFGVNNSRFHVLFCFELFCL